MPQSATSSPLSDADLLAQFHEHRHQEAFAQLVARHAPMVLAVCRSVLGNTADAEDAAQAVFLTLAQKSSLRHTSLAGWLHRVAWYISARAAEARSIRTRHEKEAAAMTPPLAHAPQSDDSISPELLHANLAKLPEKYRIPLLLHHIEGRTQEETAALLGTSVGAVAMRLNRGRQLLRDRLSADVRQPVPASSVLGAFVPIGMGGGLPAAFLATATKAAALAASQQLATTSILSATSLALSKGAMNMLFWTKVKLVAAMIAVVLFTGGAVGTFVAVAQTSTATPTQIAGGGNITALDATSVTITRDNVATTVTVNASTVIKLDGAVKTLADLKTGLYALAFGSGTTATELRVYTPKPTTTTQPTTTQPGPFLISGSITAAAADSITVQQKTTSMTVAIDASTVIKLDNQVTTAAALKAGLYVGVFGTAGKPAIEIRAYTPKPAGTTQIAGGGTITAVSATSISIQRGTQTTTVAIDSSTVVTIDTQPSTAANLKIGQYAGAWGANGKATEIKAFNPKPKP